MQIRKVAFAFLAALVSCFAVPLVAQDTALVTLETGQDGRGYEGVGRLDIRGKGFCTAALIEERLILTAAHCIFDDTGAALPADRFTFFAGLRNGRAEATRGVSRIVTHPNFVPNGIAGRIGSVAFDIAVLELDQPIRSSRVLPFPISTRPVAGDAVGVVSYGAGREEYPSLQKVCSVLERQLGSIVMDCDVAQGSSGAPVFSMDGGTPRIVSIISALGQTSTRSVSLGTSLEGPLQELLAQYATLGPAKPGGTQSLMTAGERNGTGAKFVRP